MEKNYNVLDVVWARARKPKSEIFWPAQVVESEDKISSRCKKKIVACVKFLGEDTYGDVKDIKDIKDWDCKEQSIFIKNGRASIKDVRKKVSFNKGILEAKKIFAGQKQYNKDHDDKQDTPKGHKPNIKFVDDSKVLVTKKCQMSKDGNDQATKGDMEKNIKSVTRKRLCTNDSKQSESKDFEPLLKRRRSRNSCEMLSIDQNKGKSPRKLYGKDSEVHDIEVTKGNSSGRDISTDKVPIIKTPEFVGKLVNDRYTENGINDENSSEINGKRKREEKTESNGCVSAVCESRDKGTHNSRTLTKSSKQTEKKDKKITEKKQIIKQKRRKKLFSESKDDVKSEGMKDTSPKGDNVVDTGQNKDEWESDSCLDDELMETALSPSQKDLKFEQNNIVWAKLFRKPFWPAQVKRISKKAKKIYVRFLGYDNKTCISCKRLEPFACDSEKREQFMKDAKEYDPERFNDAFTTAEDLVRKKALGISAQPDDKEEEECALVDTEEVGESSLTGAVPEHKLKEPVNFRRLIRTKKKPSKYKDILTYIRESKPFLKEIFEEKRQCERHFTFKSGSAKEKNSLKRRSGFGPVSDSDLENDIMDFLQGYYRELSEGKEDFSEVTYISDVWLPEAIIYGIQKIDNTDEKTAESIYLKGSGQGTNSRRFMKRLKAKTLTDEERKECLNRANRALSTSLN